MSTDTQRQDDRERRKSSADNLERLYTMVAALCLATAVGRLLSGTPDQGAIGAVQSLISEVRPEVAPMFVALVVTLLPFYHGANRYLFDTYVLAADAPPSSLGVMSDFAFFFTQAILFNAMAQLSDNGAAFYALFVVLLLLDCLWSALALLARRATWSNARLWLVLNIVTVILVVIATVNPWWTNGTAKWTALALLAVVRTVIDYTAGHAFYWPGLTLWGSGHDARPAVENVQRSTRLPRRRKAQ